MKKLFILFTIALFTASCGGSDNKGSTANSSQAATEEKKDPELQKGLELVAKSDCFGCHQIKDKSTGPSYEAIAAKYPNNQAVIDSLAGKIIHGGAGNWGTIPMTPHSDISENDAKLMVKYVLSLKP